MVHFPSLARQPSGLTGDVLIEYDSPWLISLLLVIKSCLVLFSFNDKWNGNVCQTIPIRLVSTTVESFGITTDFKLSILAAPTLIVHRSFAQGSWPSTSKPIGKQSPVQMDKLASMTLSSLSSFEKQNVVFVDRVGCLSTAVSMGLWDWGTCLTLYKQRNHTDAREKTRAALWLRSS